jgi:catechol 2,3-dioxygenase-like lactoylglutathione lyase family enzyme
MVQGLSHLTFIVRDLDRMESILTTVLGARRVYDSGNETFSLSRERFFLIGGSPGDLDAPAPIWVAIMEGEALPSRTYNHVAFKIADADYPALLERVRALGLDVREAAPVSPAKAARSIFTTPTIILLNCIPVTLGERLKRYAEGR